MAASATPPARSRIGLLVKGEPTAPGHPLPIWHGDREVGHVTGMAYSKRVGTTIAVGLIQTELADSTEALALHIDGTAYPATLHPVPFL